MAFEGLQERLQVIFKKISGQGKLTEANMDEMLKEIRMALLEADVNFKVVKHFVNDVKEKAIGQKVISSLTASQMVVKIVKEELVESDEEMILQYMRTHNNEMPYTSKSSAEVIEEVFHMSRKAFKRALGDLYKNRKVICEEDKTVLVK